VRVTIFPRLGAATMTVSASELIRAQRCGQRFHNVALPAASSLNPLMASVAETSP
jgi:hypothetical protein